MGGVEGGEDVAGHGVLNRADAVVEREEADGQLQPVVGEPPVDRRPDVRAAQEEAALQFRQRRLGEGPGVDGVAVGRVEEDLLGAVAVGGVADGDADLLPEVGEVAGVVEDGGVEDLVVGDGDDPAGVLAAGDPHGRVGVLDGRGLAHLHDGRLHEPQRDDVAADAPHDDPVADAEGVAAEDDDVGGEGGDDPLERERDAGRDQPEERAELGRFGEPDGDDAEEEEDRQEEVDPLPRPEAQALVPPAGDQHPGEGAEGVPEQEDRHDQAEGEEEALAGPGVEPDEPNTLDPEVAVGGVEVEPVGHGDGFRCDP